MKVYFNNQSYKHHLTCSQETKKLITNECIDELKKHNPNLKDFKIPQGYIIKRMVNYYLGRDQQ